VVFFWAVEEFVFHKASLLSFYFEYSKYIQNIQNVNTLFRLIVLFFL